MDRVDTHVKVLDNKEKKWLHELQTPIKIGVTQIPNQVLKIKSTYSGYSIDLFKKIESILDVKFDYVYYDTWGELLKAAKDREVDIVFLAQKTEQRLHYLNFTDIVLIQHNKILSSSKNYLHIGMNELLDKKVAVVKGSAIDRYISDNYPRVVLIHSKSERDSLNKLLNGLADYTVIEPVRASYYIKKNNIDNLYIAGDFPYDYKLHIATRNDLPILNIVLNKAIENINPAEKKALALKWGYEKDVFFDTKLLVNILIIFTIIMIFLFYLSILNRKLKKAKKSLREINKTLEQRIEEEVSKNRKKDLVMLEQSRFAQMGQVINMITHQWRQPLNNLSLITQSFVIKCQKNNSFSKEIDYFKDKTVLQIKQMSQTIDDFRDFFKQQKQKSDFYLNDILKSVANIVEPILDKSNIKLEVNKIDMVEVNGFSNEFFQAILNIIYNAKDALISNKIENKVIRIILKDLDEKAILYIEDNAGGIPKEIMKDIFEPYFSTKGENGTGIGLYMSKMIIEQHMDGKLSVENGSEGAVFKIELPKILRS